MAKLRVVGETKYPKKELTRIVVENLKSRLSVLERQITELEGEAHKMERKYGMKWEVFRQKFATENLGEEADLDYVEWHAATELLRELYKERDFLTEVLG